VPTLTTHLGLSKPDAGQEDWNGLMNGNLDALDAAIADIPASPTLATVAETGSYTDLVNVPTTAASITLIDTVTGLPVVITIADGALTY
jgi:pectin methylesterase-like acyl-CoA thioesterase